MKYSLDVTFGLYHNICYIVAYLREGGGVKCLSSALNLDPLPSHMQIYSRKKRLEIKVFQMKTSQGKICRLSRLKEILVGGGLQQGGVCC